MNKKRIILYSVLIALAVAVVLLSIFMPVVQVIGHADDADKTIVYNKAVSLFVYLIDMPFLLTEAGDIYFTASGPIWMATLSIMLHVLLVVGGIVLMIACVYELCATKMKNSAPRNNVLAKKLAYFVGWLCVAVAIFSIISCSVTTLLSNGYAEFLFSYGEVVFLALGIAIVVLAKQTEKRKPIQQPTKLKNALGYCLAAIFAAFVVALAFVPVYQEYIFDVFGPGYTSIYSVAGLSLQMATDPYMAAQLADFVFGISLYVWFAVVFAAAFVLVYSIIGFILTLANKKTNWLSSRIKRWSMALLIMETILCLFVIAECAAWISSLTYPNLQVMTIWAYVIPFAAYLPYVVSTMVSVEKKNKNGEEYMQNAEDKPQEPVKSGWLEPNEIPNDVISPNGENQEKPDMPIDQTTSEV